MRHDPSNSVRFLLPFALVSVAACADTSLSQPPAVVFAVFDPAASPPVVPLPNDLAMVTAQPATVAVAPFSGPLDPTTVRADDVLAIDLTTAAPIAGITPVFNDMNNRLIVMPPMAGWPMGRVAIVLRGGSTGLRGAGGEPVVATPAFFFARSPQPVATCATPQPGCASTTPALTTEQAIGLEQLRQAFTPLFTALEARGLMREDVVLAWTFTVTA